MIYSPTAFVGDFLLLRQQTARGTCGTVPVGTRSQTPLAPSAAAKAFALQTPSPWLRHGAAVLRTAGLPRRRTTVRLPVILKKPRSEQRFWLHATAHPSINLTITQLIIAAVRSPASAQGRACRVFLTLVASKYTTSV